MFCYFICGCHDGKTFKNRTSLGEKYEFLIRAMKLVGFICDSFCECGANPTTTISPATVTTDANIPFSPTHGITTYPTSAPPNQGLIIPNIVINNNYNPCYKTRRETQEYKQKYGCQMTIRTIPQY